MTERFGTDLAGISKQIFLENFKIPKGFTKSLLLIFLVFGWEVFLGDKKIYTM